MQDLLFAADCLVFPTRGEGFGIPPLEAMATGLPVICTNWSGPADYLDPADSLPLDYAMQPAREFYLIYKDYLAPGETTGFWAEPSLDDLVEQMRWAESHRGELGTMGRRAATRVAAEWTWQGKVERLITLLDHQAP